MKNKQDKDFQKFHRTVWQDFLWNRFLEKMVGVKTKKEAGGLVNSLFSEYEKSLITKRLAALALIRSGMGSRAIGRLLWTSSATISALKKNFFGSAIAYKSQRHFFKTPGIKKTSSSSRISYGSFWLEELLRDVDIIDLLKNPPRPAGMGLKSKEDY